MAYATGRCMCHAQMRIPFEADDVVAMVRKVFAGRVVFHDGTEQLAPGITVHHIGGHSKGLQCVRVKTRRGHVVLASDATHLYAHITEGRVFPITYSVADTLEGYATLRKLADSPDHIVPGHDPQVLERYPAARRESRTGSCGWMLTRRIVRSAEARMKKPNLIASTLFAILAIVVLATVEPGAGRRRVVSVALGRGRSARRGQPHHAGQGSRGEDLITRGAVYQLGRVYEAGMPLFGTRHYSLRIPAGLRAAGTNQTIYHDEVVSGELGQVGTQFDGLGHIGIGDLFYNGNNRRDFAQAEGLTKLGIENVGAITTRGVLIDVAAFKGVAAAAGRLRDHASPICRARSNGSD